MFIVTEYAALNHICPVNSGIKLKEKKRILVNLDNTAVKRGYYMNEKIHMVRL